MHVHNNDKICNISNLLQSITWSMLNSEVYIQPISLWSKQAEQAKEQIIELYLIYYELPPLYKLISALWLAAYIILRSYITQFCVREVSTGCCTSGRIHVSNNLNGSKTKSIALWFTRSIKWNLLGFGTDVFRYLKKWNHEERWLLHSSLITIMSSIFISFIYIMHLKKSLLFMHLNHTYWIPVRLHITNLAVYKYQNKEEPHSWHNTHTHRNRCAILFHVWQIVLVCKFDIKGYSFLYYA